MNLDEIFISSTTSKTHFDLNLANNSMGTNNIITLTSATGRHKRQTSGCMEIYLQTPDGAVAYLVVEAGLEQSCVLAIGVLLSDLNI